MIFDTGANISTVTGSETKRLGFVVRDSTAYIKGSTDKKNPLQVALARMWVAATAIRLPDVFYGDADGLDNLEHPRE